MATLEHLILQPHEGLCNRLRAIASARRLCAEAKARCTVVWDWGDPTALFEPAADVEWAPKLSDELSDRASVIRHLSSRHMGEGARRTVPISTDEKIVLFSDYIFNTTKEDGSIALKDLKPWILRPVQKILDAADVFASTHFKNTVGMHMRRTDHKKAIHDSPDELFIAKAEELVKEGHTIFLSTDNEATRSMMREKFGPSIILYPKDSKLDARWPRVFSLEETLTDLIELELLARCEYVIGTAHSSWSDTAILLNGSPKSEILKEKKP